MEPDVDTKVLAEAPDGAAATALADNRNGSQQLGRYELIQRLGHGGMATVYLARTRGIGGFQKLVAVKVIHPHLAEEQPFVRMFLDEARIAASLQNPHVGEVLDIGSADGVYYMVMEYIEGETLSSLRRVLQAKGTKLAPAIVLQILADACYGLHAVHELTNPDGEPLGLVHRDVSPQNLLMTLEGWVKLVDFGIAKAAGSESSTLTGCLRGKLPYMPPEQARGEVLSRATDLFSLGVIAWELLAGRRLFSGANEAETLQKVLACEVPSLAELRPELPPELAALVHRILAKSPKQRHSNALELRHELLAVLRKRYPASRPRLALVDVMQRHFGERYAYRRASVRRTSKHPAIRVVEDGPSIDPSEQNSTTTRAYRGLALVPPNPPASDSESQSQVSLAVEDVHTQTSTTSSALGQWPLWLGLPLVGAGIAGLAFFLGGFGSLKPAAPTSPPPARSSPASERASAHVPEPEQVAEARPASKTVAWVVQTNPPGARITITKAPPEVASILTQAVANQTTPVRLELPRGSDDVGLTLEKPGYEPIHDLRMPLADANLEFDLKPRKQRTRTHLRMSTKQSKTPDKPPSDATKTSPDPLETPTFEPLQPKRGSADE